MPETYSSASASMSALSSSSRRRDRHRDGTNSGMTIPSPAAPAIPLTSIALKPAPKECDASGIRLVACPTLRTYRAVQPSSSSPGRQRGDPRRSDEDPGQQARARDGDEPVQHGVIGDERAAGRQPG